MNEKTTNELMNLLMHTDSRKGLDAYVGSLPSGCLSFADYFRFLPKTANLSISELVGKSGIERTYLYQILNGTRNPGRDKILRICLSAHLTAEETQRALKVSGVGILYPRKRRDAVLIFAIRKGLSVDDTQELLEAFGEMLLA